MTQFEEDAYRMWTRNNYVPGTEIQFLWPEVVKDECLRMSAEVGVVVRAAIIWN